jgi:sialate O-acetylesterase
MNFKNASLGGVSIFSFCFALFALGDRPALAVSLSVHPIFSDNLVLQREAPIPVWGWGQQGRSIRVTLNEQRQETIVDGQGKWKTVLNPMPAGGPFELRIEDGKSVWILENVMVGEVWLCSGQSNMQWTVADSKDATEEIQAAANYPMIRLCGVPKLAGYSRTPQDRVDLKWKVCSPESIKDFSAVAYQFARNLLQSPALQGMAIGLIDSSFGGTRAEAWVDGPTLAANFDMAELRDSPFGVPISGCYHGMIYPLAPYALRGVLWYQGESNAGKAEQYRQLLPVLIERWRDLWDQKDLPFLFVQLPNYAEPFDGDYFTLLRESQLKVWQSVPNTGMAVTIDIGEAQDVHPKNKQDVGLRLALIARALAYGETLEYSGPVYDSMTIEGNQIRLRFSHTGGGLMDPDGGNLEGFTIAAAEGPFEIAEVRIDGDTVLVSSEKVSTPVRVRYAWAADPKADLYNQAGLPASPFKTDEAEVR